MVTKSMTELYARVAVRMHGVKMRLYPKMSFSSKQEADEWARQVVLVFYPSFEGEAAGFYMPGTNSGDIARMMDSCTVSYSRNKFV